MERNNRILLGLTIAFLLLVIVLSGVALSNSGQREPKMKVSVILDNSAVSATLIRMMMPSVLISISSSSFVTAFTPMTFPVFSVIL